MKLRAIVPIVLLLAVATSHAQESRPSHVFPQVADGRQSDGSYYVSRFWIVNVGDRTTCTLFLHGLDASRLTTGPEVVVPRGGWAVVRTRGTDPLATGYARLDCANPVVANATYSLSTAAGATAGMATVFSAESASFAMQPLLLGENRRYGIAIANDSSLTAFLSLYYTDSSNPALSNARGLQIPAQSQYTGFVDQLLALPSQGSGTLEIQAGGIGALSFRVTSLLFDGTVFTTLVPVTVR